MEAGAPPDLDGHHLDRCAHCGHSLREDARVCPNCLTVIHSTCEFCGGRLAVKWRRARVSSAVRLTLEVVGVITFVFTMGSIAGPILGVLFVAIGQLFGYEMRPHHACAACRKLKRL